MSLRAGCRSVGYEWRKRESAISRIYPINQLSQLEIFLLGIKDLQTIGVVRPTMATDVKPGKLIININTSDLLPARKYSLESFAQVIQGLIERREGLTLLLTGTAQEREYVQRLADRFDPGTVINVAGEWTLRQFMSELGECELFITCDSAPLHLAAAMNVATLALWGPTQPHHFGYANHPAMQSLSLYLSCSPCFLHPHSRPAVACRGSVTCMRNLSPSMIADSAVQLMEKLPSSREVIFPSKYVTMAADALV
jgi:ADP-heptose:LPS heptosyltransferase